MNELNPGMFNMTAIAVATLFFIAGLIAWFFVNRASSRINAQVALLDEMLDQQKRQTALLRRLCEAKASNSVRLAKDDEDENDDGLVRMVAER